MRAETTFMLDKWRCSGCGRLNSMETDNVCPRCIDAALDADADKLEQLRKHNCPFCGATPEQPHHENCGLR